MALVVTGLSQDGNVGALHKALADAGVATDSLQVIAPDESDQGMSRGLIGADLIQGGHETGTGVPGITNQHHETTFFRNEELDDRLGDLEIPDSEVGNYIEALQRGKYVVAFFAHADNADAVEAAFRAAALTNVRRY